MKLYVLLLSMLPFALFGQAEKKLVRKGNSQYKDKNYAEAEIDYRKALETTANSGAAMYNLGNSLFRQKKYDEALQEYTKAADAGMHKNDIAKAYHNIGNAYLMTQKYQESIDAFKKALKNNPNDMETKYNLAFAQKLQKNPPKQDQQNKDKDDKNKKDNKDQQNKDQQKNDQSNKDNKDQQSKDQQSNNNKKDDKKDGQKQPQPGTISKDDANRMLQAIQNDEKNTQDKLKKEKVQGQKTHTDIDW